MENTSIKIAQSILGIGFITKNQEKVVEFLTEG